MGDVISQRNIFKQNVVDEDFVYKQLQDSYCTQDHVFYAGNLLKKAYERYPDSIALIGKERTITYRELFFYATELSNRLIKEGLQPQDRVLLYCENSLDFYVAYWAIWQCAAVIVPVNTYLHKKELLHIMADATPAIVITSPQFFHIAEEIVVDAINSPKLLVIQNIINWDKRVNEECDVGHKSVQHLELPVDELCLLLYTSGTTGQPKGVMLSSKNVVTNVLQVAARIKMCNLQEGERFFCVLPLFHVFAQNVCIWVPTITGSSVIVVEKIDRKLILNGLKHRPTLFIGVPALYGLLCLMKTAPLDSVKFFVSGADMLPDKIRGAFSMIYGRKIASGYGLTETAPVIAINYNNCEEPTDAVGPVLSGVDCEIRSNSGESLPAGNTGTLWIKGNNVMLGYYKMPEATAHVLHNGWLNTGDFGMIDDKGILFIKGRLKDVIIHKGFNIYPAEIENVLLTHSNIFKVAVVGQAEEMSGQVPVAFLAVKTKNDGLEKELRDLCIRNLATYKIPRKFFYLDDLPMNATGKIDKKQLLI